ncbi:MAG: serine/threonine protein kinase, partial [Phycisphaerales bacterium]
MPDHESEQPTASVGPDAPTHARPPERIDRYEILSVIGEGGMGVVYRARQEKPAREVALKVIRAGVPTSEQLRRFELEADVLGRLKHPGIAQVYDAGTLDEGAGAQPYFAMELVDGQPLTKHAAARGLSVRDRLALFAKVCDAVQHAHGKGVIHRDLKPGNILVTPDGEPKVLDFGVARLTDADVQSVTMQTDIGQLIGTVPYMSPEQVAGDPGDLDTRSDVYALGVVLYELLTDRLPYDLRQKMIAEAARIIQEEEPTSLSSVSRALRGDIETIVGTALAKEKDRRYASASAFAADLRRFLQDEPIAARPPSASYQLQKFARRNKALVGGVVATFIALAGGLVGTTTFALGEAQQRQAADQARAEAERIAEFQAEQLSAIEPELMGVRLRASILDAAPEAS